MTSFAAKATAETANAFGWAGQPPKIALSRGDIDPHLILVSVGPPKSVPKQHLDRVSRFCRVHEQNSGGARAALQGRHFEGRKN